MLQQQQQPSEQQQQQQQDPEAVARLAAAGQAGASYSSSPGLFGNIGVRGRGGCGEPVRDGAGNIVSNLKRVIQSTSPQHQPTGRGAGLGAADGISGWGEQQQQQQQQEQQQMYSQTPGQS